MTTRRSPGPPPAALGASRRSVRASGGRNRLGGILGGHPCPGDGESAGLGLRSPVRGAQRRDGDAGHRRAAAGSLMTPTTRTAAVRLARQRFAANSPPHPVPTGSPACWTRWSNSQPSSPSGPKRASVRCSKVRISWSPRGATTEQGVCVPAGWPQVHRHLSAEGHRWNHIQSLARRARRKVATPVREVSTSAWDPTSAA